MHSKSEVDQVLALVAEGMNDSHARPRADPFGWLPNTIARRQDVAAPDAFIGPKA